MTAIGRASTAGTGRALRRNAVAALGAAAIAVLSAAPATAGQPNRHACLGEDIRMYAEGGAQFGGFVSGVLADDGVAPEILAHLAGLVDDATIPNSCND